MGWQISVVDGGFTDMYPNMATLADGKVILYWALHYDSISFAVRGTRPSNWLAIAFGRWVLDFGFAFDLCRFLLNGFSC